MRNKWRGKLVELEFFRACLLSGWTVYTPLASDGPVDAVIDRGHGLERVQIKSGSVPTRTPGVVRVDLRRNSKNSPKYGEKDIDLLVVGYDRWFWMIPWPETGDVYIDIPLACASSKYEQWRHELGGSKPC